MASRDRGVDIKLLPSGRLRIVITDDFFDADLLIAGLGPFDKVRLIEEINRLSDDDLRNVAERLSANTRGYVIGLFEDFIERLRGTWPDACAAQRQFQEATDAQAEKEAVTGS